MIEFNLLPNVKLEFVRSQRLKHLVMLVSVLAAGVALVILIFFIIFVDIVQKKNISDLNGRINANSKQLQAIPSLNKILTVQNQLSALPALHNQKPVASRLFGYMTQVTPSQLTISNLKADFVLHSVTITGDAPSLAVVNQFADTLKFTTYTTANSSKAVDAFSQVQLASFGRTDKGASYTLQVAFDPLIFDGATTPTLTVPKIVSTRSETEHPTDLFQQSTTTTPTKQ
jgi:hypothetical protein